MSAPALVPLDPDIAAQVADADLDRAKRFIRKRLAEGSMSSSQRRIFESELRDLERPPTAVVVPIR